MKFLALILVAAIVSAALLVSPTAGAAETPDPWGKDWEDVISVLTGTGPTIPSRIRPSKASPINASAAKALAENKSVKLVNASKYGRPLLSKGVWLEYPRINVAVAPMRSRVSKPGGFPRREIHNAMLLLKRRPTDDPCVLIATFSVAQASSSARVQESVTFSTARGTPFLSVKKSGKRLVLERLAKGATFTGAPCLQADGGIGDCINDTDVPDIWEPPCEFFWLPCAAVTVAKCIGDHW